MVAEHDAMHLAPVFCGVTGWGQIEQLRPALAQPPSKNPYWRPLAWPPIIITIVEAASTRNKAIACTSPARRSSDAGMAHGEMSARLCCLSIVAN